MRFVRAAVIIIFVLALGIYGVSEWMQLRNRDTTIPEISSDRDVLKIPCQYTQEQLMEGMSASDGKDGDLTSQIIAGSFSRFIEKGICNLTYVVFDSANQSATLNRKIQFKDYHSPRFSLTEPLIFTENEGSYIQLLSRIRVSDMLDGDLTDWITQIGTDVKYQRVGDYTTTLSVSNSFGDTITIDLPIHVVNLETQRLDIQLSDNIVYLKKGKSFDPNQYIKNLFDAQGKMLDTDMVSASSDVDTQTPGCYEVHYKAEDKKGNQGQTWLTVVVEE
ncbi:Pesticidal crystal protein cry22Aa [Clostridiales bacterium CHKCI001]|nr:Pesticidal crystal protein cry22Aa [Clostridiales bacterium CHKCI001]